MRGPGAASLLDLWDHASQCGPHERAVHLLAWALPDQETDDLADLDLGLRDWHLLRLRRALFGSQLSAYIDCPHCGERLEIELDAQAMQDDTPPPPAPLYVSADGRRFRLPTSRDLIKVSDADDVEEAARELFARCTIGDDASASKPRAGDASIDGTALDDIDHGLATLAAERALRLALCCAACQHRWECELDPGAFLWEEIRARALSLLDDVHRLACAYGWSEPDILALSDARRAAYLSRVD